MPGPPLTMFLFSHTLLSKGQDTLKDTIKYIEVTKQCKEIKQQDTLKYISYKGI